MSIVGIDLKGKTVIVRKGYFKPEYQDKDRRFRCEGGFGCNPEAMGTAVFGVFLLDDEQARISRGDVESVIEDSPTTASQA